MKKILLIVAAALMAVSASAQLRMRKDVNPQAKHMPSVLNQKKGSVEMKKSPRKATTEKTIVCIPENAEMSLYEASYYMETMFGMAYYSGLSLKVYTDGNDVYFENLFLANYYMPVKGTKQEDGSIVIKKQLVYEGIDYNGDGSEYDDLSFTTIAFDDEDNPIFPDDDIVLKPTEDGGYAMPGTVDFPYYYGLGDQYGYYWALCANLEIKPFTPTSEAVELPEGAEVKEAVFKHKFMSMGDTTATSNLSEMSTVGTEVYLKNLCPDAECWVKGSVKDGKLVVPTDQFLGADNTYLLTLRAGKNMTYSFEWIDMDYYEYSEVTNYEPTDCLTFSNVDGKWVLDEGLCVVESMADGSDFGVYFGQEVQVYPGDVPATPADPTVVLYDYMDLIGSYVLSANIPAEDVNGNYIRPEYMEVSLWEDGDMMTFSPDDQYYVSEDITWMPWGWMDDAGGYDLAFTTLTPNFYLYEDLFEEIGLQVRYTVNGESHTSNVVYARIEEDPETGVKTLVTSTESKSEPMYNLAGQRVSKAYKGIKVCKGKKVF